MRDLKNFLEDHPIYLLLTLVLAALGLIFITIDLNDKLHWNLI